MKRNTNYSPYATFSLEKITSPKGKPKGEPKGKIKKSSTDLRGGRKN